jgi:integrase
MLIRLEHEDNVRRRRISEDEEARLLDMAPPLLRFMIIAALDTGIRRGEMLALRFADIDLNCETHRAPRLDDEERQDPLRPHLDGSSANRSEMAAHRRGRQAQANNTPVFSDEVGEPVGCFKGAWTLTVLKAHGISPQWTREYGWKEASPECKRLLREIDLRWHDLHQEYASRLVERGVPLAQVRDLLGQRVDQDD